MLSALENVEFPLLFQGGRRARRRGRARAGARWTRWACATSCATGPTSSRAASGSAWPWPAPWSPIPAIVLADEPTANLDSATGEAIIELMLEINRRDGTTFIFSTHDPRVMGHAHRVVRLADGRLDPSSGMMPAARDA